MASIINYANSKLSLAMSSSGCVVRAFQVTNSKRRRANIGFGEKQIAWSRLSHCNVLMLSMDVLVSFNNANYLTPRCSRAR
jgi:hypothetical protein